uniref:Uncharacterized protein n=1 Tax=Arion vulgaris TaxID=1028688 RepID=A0A0B7AJK3_9EUPU
MYSMVQFAGTFNSTDNYRQWVQTDKLDGSGTVNNSLSSELSLAGIVQPINHVVNDYLKNYSIQTTLRSSWSLYNITGMNNFVI